MRPNCQKSEIHWKHMLDGKGNYVKDEESLKGNKNLPPQDHRPTLVTVAFTSGNRAMPR